MRRKLIVGLLIINCSLASLLVVTPAQTQLIPLFFVDCCQPMTLRAESEYCCEKCCWYIPDCDDDDDCNPPEQMN